MSAWQSESMPLADRGLNVLDQFYNDSVGTEKSLAFVTHSMGGLVAKQVLQQAETMGVTRYESIARNTVGAAYIATPHSGANLANFASFASAVLRTNPQVDGMKKHSAELRKLHGWFLHYVKRRDLVCRTWCERKEVKPDVLGLKLPKGMIVVDETSAEPNIPGERAIPLDEDHISICKPASQDHQIYKGVKKFLEECLSKAKVKNQSQAN